MQLAHAITTASPSPLSHLVRSGVGEHAAVALQIGGTGRDAGTIRSYHRDQEIFAEGDPADLFFEVITGTVRTYRLLLDGRRQIDASISRATSSALRAAPSIAFAPRRPATSRCAS